jgi:ABC-2 type transport system ATP-binding protein
MFKSCHISKSFRGSSGHFWEGKRLVLDQVNFEVQSGSITGFLGANGAGKTTFIKLMLGLIKADSGVVEFSKELGSSRLEINQLIGYLPERPYFYPHLSGMEFCQYMGSLCQMSRDEINERSKYWGDKLRISFAFKQKIKSYSKGMLQRLGMVASLMHNPKLLVLDEPFSGVDPIGRKELKDIVLECNQAGATVFFSTHILSDVEEICDQIIFLKDGVVNYAGPLIDLMKMKSSHEYLIQFTGVAKNELNLAVMELKDESFLINVQEIDKEKIIEDLIKKGAKIISVERERRSLEDILYLRHE